MSRIEGRVVENAGEFAVGRLSHLRGDYDSAERVASWLCPSYSRDPRAYICELDFLSTECSCGCECFQFRNAGVSPMNRSKWGTDLEHLAFISGHPMLPSILRNPRGLCCHLQKIRAWVKRHGLLPVLEERSRVVVERIEERRKQPA
jgi:hypothetical protein